MELDTSRVARQHDFATTARPSTSDLLSSNTIATYPKRRPKKAAKMSPWNSSSAQEESDEESDEDGSEMEGIEVDDGEQLVDDKLDDEMDEFGYSQVLDDDEDSGDEDARGPDDEDTF